jgi:hypothetical protein
MGSGRFFFFAHNCHPYANRELLAAEIVIVEELHFLERYVFMRFVLRVSASLVCFVFLFMGYAYSESISVEAPGVKVESRRGWFGTESHRYQDGLGNSVIRDKDVWGRRKSSSKIFGTEFAQTPRETRVLDAQGNPLIQSRNTWFHGKETRIDGNAILNSFQGLFQP